MSETNILEREYSVTAQNLPLLAEYPKMAVLSSSFISTIHFAAERVKVLPFKSMQRLWSSEIL